MKIGNYEIQVPFVTTSTENVKTVLELADITTATKAVDLGSGDGRMILAFGKQGATVDGFELKKELIDRTRKRINDSGLQQTVTAHNASFWDANFSNYNLIYIYGMKSIMHRLEEKLDNEALPGTKVILNIFTLPRWKVKKTKNMVHLYIKA